MKKTNLLKMSTCVIGLGMMLSGINSVAMEERYEKISAGIEESKRATFKEVFDKEIASGKGEFYAEHFAKMVAVDGIHEDMARCAMEVYLSSEKKFEKNRLFIEYVTASESENTDTETDEEIEESKRAAFEEVYNKELASGKSEIYAEYYAKLVVVKGIDKSQAELRADIFEKRRCVFKNDEEFSEIYAKLVVDGCDEKEAEWETEVKLKIKRGLASAEDFRRRFLDSLYEPAPAKSQAESSAKIDYSGKDFIPMEFWKDESVLKLTRKELIEGSDNVYTRLFGELLEGEVGSRRQLSSDEIEEEIKERGANVCAFHYLKQKSYWSSWRLEEDEMRKGAEELESKIKNDEDFAYFFVELLNTGLEYNTAIACTEVAYKKFKEGHSRKNSLFYVDLIIQGANDYVADKYIDEYERLIEEGESEVHAYLYAYYLVKDVIKPTRKKVKSPDINLDKVKRLTAIAEREVLSGKSSTYATYYTKLVSKGMNEAKARKCAEFFEIGKSKFTGIKSDEFISLYARVMGEGFYENKALRIVKMAESRVRDKKDNEDRAIWYAKLVICYGIDEKKAERLCWGASRMMREGKSEIYIRLYSELYARGTNVLDIERQITIAESEIINGRSYEYALKYSELIIKGLSESAAREEIEQFEQRIKAEKSKTFLEFLSISTEREVNANIAMRQAKIAEEKFKEGHSKEASLYYAELITHDIDIDKITRQLAAFEEQMKIGKGDLYARFFAKSIGRGVFADTARRQAETAEKLFLEKYTKPDDGIVLMYRDYVNYDTVTGEVRVSKELFDVLRRERIHKDIEEVVKELKYAYYKHYAYAKYLSFYNAELLSYGLDECDAEKKSKNIVYEIGFVRECFC